MPTPTSRFVVACAAVFSLCALLAATAPAKPAPQTAPGDPIDPRTYAPESKPFLALHATGVQKYTCGANAAWVFTDPEATLFRTGGKKKPAGTHYLNVATGRPVWRLNDGSSVEAARVASAPGAPGSIAWLLLAATATESGEGDRLAGTTWVQRLNTSGGLAPTGACTPGDKAAVPYSTDYVFWKATRDEDDDSDD